jgi:ABC-type lipoprotein release transport system permease subunit
VFGPDGPPSDFDWITAAGPVVKLHIVGVIRIPAQSVVSFASNPLLLSGPGWATAHLGLGSTPPTGLPAAAGFNNALVRLRHGAADVPAFKASVARVFGRDDIPVKDLADDVKRVQRSLDVERTALLLFAGAVILAAVVLTGQAFVRSVRAGSEPVPALRAIGLSRGGLVAGLVAPHAVSVAVAAVVAVATGVGFSTRFPIGLARELDLDRRPHVDTTVLAVGVVATIVVTAGTCALVAWLTVRRAAGWRRAPRTQLVGVATRAGASVPAAVGTSLALERASTRSGLSGRPALLAAVVGVFGVVGAVTLVGGIDDALHQPERTGQTWDLEAFSALSVADGTKVVSATSDVTAFALRSRVPSVVDGVDTPLYALESLRGDIHFVTLQGRAPQSADEVALGPNTAAKIHAHIGDKVMAGRSGQTFDVTGISLLAQTPHSSFDEGALLTPVGLHAAVGDAMSEDEALIRIRPGTPIDPMVAHLATKGFSASPPIQPPDIANLAHVRSLPLWLAAFLLLLAVGAVAHALLTGVPSRRRDVAVLRALGLTPRQAAACVGWQAAVIGAVALAVGIPLGTAVGRQIWRLVADSLSFVYVGPLAGFLLLALVPVALGVLALLAVWPARGAARLDTAKVLRVE